MAVAFPPSVANRFGSIKSLAARLKSPFLSVAALFFLHFVAGEILL